VSLSEQVDTSTPMSKMILTVLRAKGKRLDRPHVSVSATKIRELREGGLTLREIARRCRVSKTSVIRALNE
jgi:DNA invertase Pin-like site-specific DNA recombinase